MKTITIGKAWDYVTPEKTVTYAPGEYEVTNEIAEAAEAAGVVKEGADGGSQRPAKAGSARTADSGES